jgi:hypothetical protein
LPGCTRHPRAAQKGEVRIYGQLSEFLDILIKLSRKLSIFPDWLIRLVVLKPPNNLI